MEIQYIIFSYDPTYRDIWKDILNQFKKCSSCQLNERVEIGWVGFPNGKIKQNLYNFNYCSIACIRFSSMIKNNRRAWIFDKFEPEF